MELKRRQIQSTETRLRMSGVEINNKLKDIASAEKQIVDLEKNVNDFQVEFFL